MWWWLCSHERLSSTVTQIGHIYFSSQDSLKCLALKVNFPITELCTLARMTDCLQKLIHGCIQTTPSNSNKENMGHCSEMHHFVSVTCQGWNEFSSEEREMTERERARERRYLYLCVLYSWLDNKMIPCSRLGSGDQPFTIGEAPHGNVIVGNIDIER